MATAFRPVKDYVATIGPEVQKTFDPTLDPNLKRILEAFGSLPVQPVPDPYLSQLSSLDISLTDRANLLQRYVAEAQTQVVASESFLGHPDWVPDRTNQSIAANGGLRNVLLHGAHLVLYSNLSSSSGTSRAPAV